MCVLSGTMYVCVVTPDDTMKVLYCHKYGDKLHVSVVSSVDKLNFPLHKCLYMYRARKYPIMSVFASSL